MNTGAPLPSFDEAQRWVLAMQTKLHQWATDEIDNSDSHTVYYSNDSIYSTGAIMTWNEDKREIAFPGKLEDCTAYGDGRVRCIVEKTE